MNSAIRATIGVFVLAALCLLAMPAKAAAAGASIYGATLERTPALSLSFAVKDAFTREIEEAIKSGVPTSFTFRVRLSRVKKAWFDDEVGNWEFKHTVRYDTLKEEYEVSLDETAERGIRTKDFSEMKALMATVRPMTLVPSKPLVPGKEHRFMVMAELKTVKLPFLLHHMLFFVKLWDFETDWHVLGFTP